MTEAIVVSVAAKLLAVEVSLPPTEVYTAR